MKIRTDLMNFAEAIEQTLRRYDNEKSDSYKTWALKLLFDKHTEEYEEVTILKDTYPLGDNDPDEEDTIIVQSLARELLDEAAMYMMLWVRLKVEARGR